MDFFITVNYSVQVSLDYKSTLRFLAQNSELDLHLPF